MHPVKYLFILSIHYTSSVKIYVRPWFKRYLLKPRDRLLRLLYELLTIFFQNFFLGEGAATHRDNPKKSTKTKDNIFPKFIVSRKANGSFNYWTDSLRDTNAMIQVQERIYFYTG